MTDTTAPEGMITPALVRLDVSLGSDKTQVIHALAAQVAEAGRTAHADRLAQDALAREATASTGLPGGIAIPHCRTTAVDVPTLAFARLSPGTDFGAKDGPADLAFLIAAPAVGDPTHLQVLTQLARALVKKSFTDRLRGARLPEDVVALVNEVVSLPPGRPQPASGTPQPTQGQSPAGVAATSAASAPNAGSDTPAPAASTGDGGPVPSGSGSGHAAGAAGAGSTPTSGSADTDQIITPALVRLDVSLGSDKTEVIRALAAQVAHAGRTTRADQLVEDALAREATSATGLPGGIAIPHCRTEAVDAPTLAFARLSPGTDFGAKDGPADLAFLIAAPAGGGATHLKVLTQLARALVKKDFTDGLRQAQTPEEVVGLVTGVVTLPAAPAAGGESTAANGAASSGPAGAGTTSSGSASAGGGATAVGAGAAGSNGSAGDGTSTAGGSAGTTTADPNRRRALVAVTACPTGIAHTYMAAEALEAAAKRAGIDLVVETQGSAGATPLPPETIRNADAVIFAVDVGVRDRSRFAGKPLVASGVKRPMDDADAMIAEALRYADDPNSPRVEGGAGGGDGDAAATGGGGSGESWGARTRRVLMTGVSYMIPFVAAGGLLIALSFLFGGYEIVGPFGDIVQNNTLFDPPDVQALGLDHALFGSGVMAYLGALMFVIGQTAFAFFIPALAGYIAYAIADRPGIAPGFVMGGLAANVGKFTDSDGGQLPVTGFIGAIIGGVLAGVIARWIGGWNVPKWARGLMPVLVIPLLTSLIAGFLMLLVFGRPITWLMDKLNEGLTSMSGSNAIVLGVILGLMMAFDMGGPLNKVAYSFAAAGVGAAAAASFDDPRLKIMAAVMLAGMVPPIALALATVVRPQLFTQAERENGKAGWLLGASFITEGAIPFAAADPLRVIPAIMLGSAVTGGLAQAFDIAVRAPHGGIFVIFAVNNILGYVGALIAGVLVGAAAVVVLKSMGKKDSDVEAEAKSDAELATV
ncbi:MAG TPA: fructose-specific PTS transporter subunit EIIC [Nocardioidaceae bacterium]|nr:fructose-specific PTS transporter subunit EIIC [Nocardioidaceae bacterium]